MPTLLPSQIDDIATLSISNFKYKNWVDISLEHPEYTQADFFKKNRVVEDGGYDIRWKLQVENGLEARNTGLFAQDVTGADDLAIEGVVPWTKQTVNWIYDVDEPKLQGGSRTTIVSTLQMREHAAFNRMAELNERNLWSSPTSSTQTEKPLGVPFWLQKDATTTPAGDFNGGNPSGFSAGAGSIDASTYANWKNWAFGWTSVSPTDLVAKIKKAIQFTHFMPPNPHPELGFGESDYCMYTVWDVRDGLERLAESRNENLGADVARYMNATLVGGIPVKMVHYLDANDSTGPIYGVNFKVLRPFVLEGCDMRKTLKKSGTQHTVRECHYDTWMNYVCVNRRLCFVGSNS